MKGIYVDLIDGNISAPQDFDFKDQSEKLINLVETRLKIQIEENKYTSYKNDSTTLPWFLKATDDTEKRKFILGSESMGKLAELGNARDWINWLKNKYDKADEESRKLLERELSKQVSNDEKDIPKWRVKFRLYSDSHSVRQKSLNEWNKFNSWIQLTAVSDRRHKNEILVDVISPMKVTIQNVFLHSWYVARVFTLSLNMGLLGFFWWNLPNNTNKYYESAFDIEKSEFKNGNPSIA